MAEETHVLRMPINEHQHLRAARQAAHTQSARRTRGHAVAHHAAAGDEKAGHLLRQGGENGGLVTSFQLRTAHNRDGHGQVADVGGVARAGHHHFVQYVIAVCDEAVKGFGGSGGSGQAEGEQGEGQ